MFVFFWSNHVMCCVWVPWWLGLWWATMPVWKWMLGVGCVHVSAKCVNSRRNFFLKKKEAHEWLSIFCFLKKKISDVNREENGVSHTGAVLCCAGTNKKTWCWCCSSSQPHKWRKKDSLLFLFSFSLACWERKRKKGRELWLLCSSSSSPCSLLAC